MYCEHEMWSVSGAHQDDSQGKGRGELEREKENTSLRGRHHHNDIVSGNNDEW